MEFDSEKIRLLFGLKLRQMRLDKNLSQQELATRSGVSHSYVNEIEKGKKYPKTEKIIALAKAMDVSYDTLVSVQLNRKMEPIYQLLQSNLLTDLPLSMFGVEPADLLELLSEAPVKLSAFISTVAEIARNHNLSVDQFYFSVLRTYQEMQDNYFEDIELVADSFLTVTDRLTGPAVDEPFLRAYLTEQCGYRIELFDETTQPGLTSLRSVLIPHEKRLLLNKSLTPDQRAFTLGREVGFLFMNLTNRPLTSSWVEISSFDEVLNNFRASYFSGAILIRRHELLPHIDAFLNQSTWNEASLLATLNYFQATPETLLHRMSNLLPRYFGINEFFFLRFEHENDSPDFILTKEMHLARMHNPHGTTDGHYCRRWVALTILDELEQIQAQQLPDVPLLRAQVSSYINSQNTYFVFAFARPLTPIRHLNHSVAFGILLNDASRARIRFLDDPAIHRQEVNNTCERCPALGCLERMAPPVQLEQRRRVATIKESLAALGVGQV